LKDITFIGGSLEVMTDAMDGDLMDSHGTSAEARTLMDSEGNVRLRRHT
jgi:hypothetical protein